MLNVLAWIPKHISFSFLAVQSQSGGFHPKICRVEDALREILLHDRIVESIEGGFF